MKHIPHVGAQLHQTVVTIIRIIKLIVKAIPEIYFKELHRLKYCISMQIYTCTLLGFSRTKYPPSARKLAALNSFGRSTVFSTRRGFESL